MSQSSDNDNENYLQQDNENEPLQLRAARDSAVRAARASVRNTTRLTRLLTILNDPGPLNLLLDRVLSTLSELYMADIVVLLDPTGTGSYSPLAAIGLPEDILHLPFSDEEDSYTKRLIQTGLPLHTENAGADPKIDFQLRDLGAETVVWLPIDGIHTTGGVLILARCHPDAFAADDIDLLKTMAYRIGQTLFETQRNVQLEKIIQSCREIGQYLDLKAVSAVAARMFSSIVCAHASALVLSEPNGAVYCAAQTGLNSTCSAAICTFAEHLITSSLLEKGEPYSTADISAALTHFSLNSLTLLPVRALLLIPIHRKGILQGIIFAVRFAAIAFNSGASQLAMIYAEQISASIENSRLYQAVQNELAERKKLEEERSQWERQQQQLQKVESLNRMAGAIAHNFNNQLGAVMGNLELALMDLPPGSVSETLNEAMKASRCAAEVSSLMLTYLGQQVANYEPLDLSEICRECLTLLQVAAPKSMIFEIDLPLPGPIVNADVNQTRQVLTNLVINAWESSNERQGTIAITVTSICSVNIPATHRFPINWQPQDEIYACLEISDSGCGILEQDIEKIFDPFFSSKFTGRGLGLAVVLGIVKANGGAVVVASEYGQGSLFRVLWPISGQAVTRQQEKVAPPLAMENGAVVLLVEDEEMMRNMAATMLTRLGFKVFTARDGIEAVEMFQQHKAEIHVVVCDLAMPRLNGWETLSALRRIRPDIPVIFSSGYEEAQVITEDHPDRPNAFLHKPYQKVTLQDTLARVMNG